MHETYVMQERNDQLRFEMCLCDSLDVVIFFTRIYGLHLKSQLRFTII